MVLNSAVTPRGQTALTASRICCSASFGRWSATRRALILATARAGITVLAPSPVKPPRMPCTSSVGRAQTRSNTGMPGSPTSSRAPISFSMYSFSSKGSRAQASRSLGLGATTRS